MAKCPKVMSVLNLRPRKLGSFEEYTIALSRTLTERGGQSILVFKDLPPDSLRPYYTDVQAILETKPFEPFGRESAWELWKLLQKYKPDVVHLHFVNMLSLDVLVASIYPGVKVVFSEHASDVPKHRAWPKWQLLRASKRLFSSAIDQVVAPSDYVNGRLVLEGVRAGKVKTVHNGVNVGRFRDATSVEDVRGKYGIDAGRLLVVSISQLIPEKGIDYLIDAAGIVLREGRQVSFIHIGDGRCADEYRARVRQLGIEKHFILAGLLNLPEIGAILRESDVFTLPCTWGEAFSLVVLEALAAGKPVVVTGVGGNTEAVTHGQNGLVVVPGDPCSLAAAFETLDQAPERRRDMGEESTRRADYFDVRRWVEETIEVYRSLSA
jgi:glycosyltransferase involved in cell wall biosynthesis